MGTVFTQMTQVAGCDLYSSYNMHTMLDIFRMLTLSSVPRAGNDICPGGAPLRR